MCLHKHQIQMSFRQKPLRVFDSVHDSLVDNSETPWHACGQTKQDVNPLVARRESAATQDLLQMVQHKLTEAKRQIKHLCTNHKPTCSCVLKPQLKPRDWEHMGCGAKSTPFIQNDGAMEIESAKLQLHILKHTHDWLAKTSETTGHLVWKLSCCACCWWTYCNDLHREHAWCMQMHSLLVCSLRQSTHL